MSYERPSVRRWRRRHLRLVKAKTGASIEASKSLIVEYGRSLGIDLSFQNFFEEIANFPQGYRSPDGEILLVYLEGEAVGVVALRKFESNICEMKRLYVKPRFRRLGIGRTLVKRLVHDAASMGYEKMVLDTLADMRGATALYRRLGFKEIPPYRFNPIPGTIFMELDLVNETSSR